MITSMSRSLYICPECNTELDFSPHLAVKCPNCKWSLTFDEEKITQLPEKLREAMLTFLETPDDLTSNQRRNIINTLLNRIEDIRTNIKKEQIKLEFAEFLNQIGFKLE